MRLIVRDSVFKEYHLGEICKVHKGISFKGKHYLESGTPVLKIGNIRDGRIVKGNLFYCDENNHKVLDIHRVKYGDVAITNLAPAGKVGINLTDIEFVAGGHVFKLEPNPDVLDRKYLYYFLMNSPSQIEQMITLGNVAAINVRTMEKFKIRVPDMETQLKIIEKLDKFEELKEELKEELELRKQQSIYYRSKIMRGLQEFSSVE